MPMFPLQLAIYKGISRDGATEPSKWGALQLNPQLPHFFIKGYPKLKNFEGKFIPDRWLKEHPNLNPDLLTSREGCIFLEMASPSAPNVYDWSKKITMALSVTDMSKMLLVFEGFSDEVKIMHDPNMKSSQAGQIQKFLHLSSPKGIKVGCMLSASEKTSDGDTRKHTVPLTADEVCLLRSAIRGFIPVALGWTS